VGWDVAELAIGQTLGPYVLVDVLGRGGMAIVYKARQTSPDRYVALKVLLADLASDPEFVARFRHEANIAASVDHPNVVPIYAVGEERGFFYIAMRLVPGPTLTATIRQARPLSLDRVGRILRQVARALDYAHGKGVIHRDLKPSNVLIEAEDRVTLTDFGIARARDETLVARTQGVIGTPHYMAPEQALGQTIDYRADLYSFGVVAYEMLTGRVPFEAETPLAVLHRQVYDAPSPIRNERPDLPLALDAVIARMLAKKPEDRFASATAFVDAIDEVGSPTRPLPGVRDERTVELVEPARVPDAPPRSVGQRPRMPLLIAAVVVVAGLALVPTLGPRLSGGSPLAASPSATATAQTVLIPISPSSATPPAVVPTPSAIPTAVPTPLPPSPTPRPALPGGTIAFVSDIPANGGLFAVSPTGQNLRRLDSHEAHNPACLPSGDTVAFESNRTGVNLIYTVRLAATATPVPITSGPGNDQLVAWNPDGKIIAFSRARPGSTAIFTFDLRNHQERQLTNGTGGDWRSSYSPDGRQIVFTSTRTGNNELWLMNADGTNVRQLTHGAGDKRDPSWSPDGKWIAFRSDRDGHHWDLYKVSPSDGKIVRLTLDSNDKGFPNWSPDSQWVLFAANRGGTSEVYAMPADGGEWIPITRPPIVGGGATWCR